VARSRWIRFGLLLFRNHRAFHIDFRRLSREPCDYGHVFQLHLAARKYPVLDQDLIAFRQYGEAVIVPSGTAGPHEIGMQFGILPVQRS
jgi:hypothetical protein